MTELKDEHLERLRDLPDSLLSEDERAQLLVADQGKPRARRRRPTDTQAQALRELEVVLSDNGRLRSALGHALDALAWTVGRFEGQGEPVPAHIRGSYMAVRAALGLISDEDAGVRTIDPLVEFGASWRPPVPVPYEPQAGSTYEQPVSEAPRLVTDNPQA